MFRLLLAALLTLNVLSAAVLAADNGQTATLDAGATARVSVPEWQLVWSDEFDYQGLPDPSKWGYEEGFVRNNEPQYYTRGRLENARVEDGTLIIEARKEKFRNPGYQAMPAPGGKVKAEFAEYTSASLITLDKAAWKYGRFELRAKLPLGVGMWPAFWTLGANLREVSWPACGEVDIMEFWGRDPHRMTSCVHYRQDGGHKMAYGKIDVEESLAEFHVYALEWYPDRMDFFYDGQKYHTVPLSKLDDKDDNAFRKPHYLLMNLAVEGNGKKIDDQALPQKYVVDYVRVYQNKQTAQDAPATH
jgi:beta-glucanase (GH16 family)